MAEAVQLHILQLFYMLICKRLVLMGKTICFFNHLSIYCHVCCLLSNLKCVLWGSKLCKLHVWLWWMPQGWRWGGWLGARGGAPGTCLGQVAASRTCCVCSLGRSKPFQMCWVFGFGFFFGGFFLVFFDFQFFPLTLYFFFFLSLNLTCILSFCGVVYLAVDFLSYLVDLC